MHKRVVAGRETGVGCGLDWAEGLLVLLLVVGVVGYCVAAGVGSQIAVEIVVGVGVRV